ncbi:GNAT family N-acetyltransferase [Fusibacter sp. JL216-2]|uniref:GNAT family N-acetyltransferase n=1 Tax=Fusibacter sp. JL216-2 TaxID=3071453 RepID=UPI003D34DD20
MKLNTEQYKKLKKNLEKNVNLINFASDYDLSRVKFINDSVIITGKSDKEWTYISLSNSEDFVDIVNEIRPEDKHIATLDEDVFEYLKNHYKIEWILSCTKLVYKGRKDIPKEEVYELTQEDALYIHENNTYGDYTDVQYVKDRIKKGIGLGIKVDGKLIAWILTHDDGAMGFMNVVEAHRNKGYALKLSNETIRRLLSKDKLPFVHIEKDNTKSINLAKKAGFEYVSNIHWVKIK